MLRVFTDNCDKNTHTHTCKHTKNVKISQNITEISDISNPWLRKKEGKKLGFLGFLDMTLDSLRLVSHSLPKHLDKFFLGFGQLGHFWASGYFSS